MLTPRETEIMDLVSKGLTNKEIGRHLGIKEATVKDHLKHIYPQLGARNRVEATLKYFLRLLPA